MMMRRKLSTVDKLAMSVIMKVFEENDNIDEFIFLLNMENLKGFFL